MAGSQRALISTPEISVSHTNCRLAANHVWVNDMKNIAKKNHRQVLERYPVIDPARVGIWGHSYGGYATLLTLIHDDDHLFRCGIASALVTSWLYYNTMYTERYMGLPIPEDNLAGYEAGDVTLLAASLRGHDFFVLHGNADDNVHYQNAAKLYTALQQLDIPFEQMSYPDEAHGLAGVPMHRYNAMNRYWEKCLNI